MRYGRTGIFASGHVSASCVTVPSEWARGNLTLATRIEPSPVIADLNGYNYYGVSVLGDGTPTSAEYFQLTGGTLPVFTDGGVHSSAHIVKHNAGDINAQWGVRFGEQVQAAISGDSDGAGTECYVLDVARKGNGNLMVMLRVRQYDGRSSPSYTGMAWTIGSSPPNSVPPGTYRWVEDTPGAATQFVAIVELLPSGALYDIVTIDKANATVRATWGRFHVVRSTEAGGSYPTDRVNVFIAWDDVTDGLMRYGEGTSTNLKTRRAAGGLVGPYSLIYYKNDYDNTGAYIGIDYSPTGLSPSFWTFHDVIWDSLMTVHIALAAPGGTTAPFIGSVGNFLNTSDGTQEWVYQAGKTSNGFTTHILGMRSDISTHSVSNSPPGYGGDGIKQCFTMIGGVLVAKYDYSKTFSTTDVGSVSSVVGGVIGTTTISFPLAWQTTSLAVQISSTRLGEVAARPSPIVPADQTQPPLYVFGNAGLVSGLATFLYTYDPVRASIGMTKLNGSAWTNECIVLRCTPSSSRLGDLMMWRTRSVDANSVPNTKDDALVGVQTYAANEVIHGSPNDSTTAVTLVDAMTHLITVQVS
jgi:hypothetical protein